MKAVLDTMPDSGYADDLARHYNFPTHYLAIAEQSVGDWVVFRRPRANRGRMAYIGLAKIVAIEPDLRDPTRHFAVIQNYKAFREAVPWRVDGAYLEEVLRQIDPPAGVGVYLRGRSVRPLSDEDFERIVSLGMPDLLTSVAINVAATSGPFGAFEHEIEEAIVRRKVRDVRFRLTVCRAYDYTCAVTGLRLTDSSGLAECQAVHIRSVADDGPDIVQNAIALSSTAHWLFDRHLIAINDDHSLLVAS